MICTIHQPEHLVWNGLLDKIKQVDLFVIYDDVQFEKNNVQNRNRIRYGDTWKWLTVPIKKHRLATPINKIEISYENDWQSKYLKDLELSYSESKNFETLFPKICDIINQNYKYLIDLNLALLYLFMREFNINTKTILSSSLKLTDLKGSERLLEICKRVGADTYLSGPSGRNYLNKEIFFDAGIDIRFHHYDTKDNLSAIDTLFNYV